jgi:hypothetical protein
MCKSIFSNVQTTKFLTSNRLHSCSVVRGFASARSANAKQGEGCSHITLDLSKKALIQPERAHSVHSNCKMSEGKRISYEWIDFFVVCNLFRPSMEAISTS